MLVPGKCEQRDSRGIDIRGVPTPNADPFPAFHPPLGHTRSSSMLLPIAMRSSSSGVLFRPWLLDCLRAIRLNAVGMTQLVVANTQLQPYFAGSNWTLLSTVLNFQRQNHFDSRPLASTS